MKNKNGWIGGRTGAFAFSLTLILSNSLPANAATHHVSLSTGTVIPVTLSQELSSKTARMGDPVSVTVRSGSDDDGFPEGTQIQGVIREAQSAKNGKAGFLDIEFRHMTTPGGQSRTLAGSVIALDAKNVHRSESGRLTATPDKSKDRLKFIGIGAGAGLLIGSLTKGNKITDTVLGAAAGYLYNEFGNKPRSTDVNLKVGTEFGVRLDHAFAFLSNVSNGENAMRPVTIRRIPLSVAGVSPAGLNNSLSL